MDALTTPTPPMCPTCETALEGFVTEGNVEIDLCPRCKRAWFDRGELARVLGRKEDLDAPIDADVPMLGFVPWTCPRCRTVEMNRVPFMAGDGLMVDRCPYCGGIFCELASLHLMRNLLVRASSRRPAASENPSLPSYLRPPPAIDFRFDPDLPPATLDPRKRVLITLPTAFVAASIWRVIPLSSLVPGGARTPLHELGHAAASWVAGVPAVPIPLGLTIHGSHSYAFWFVLCAGLLAGAVQAFKHRASALFATAVGLVALCTALTFGLTPELREAWFLWWGGGGEMLFPAVMVALFHVRAPQRLRWDLARWIALPVGAFLLLDRALFWQACRRDPDLIPWGAAFSSDESDGDLSRLVQHHGWTESLILDRYIHFSELCLAVVALMWLIALLRAPPTASGDTV